MSRITRAAETDEQEEALIQIEAWAQALNWRISFGTTIGKHPQTVILDHEYQDNAIYVNADGKIKVFGEYVETLEEFVPVPNRSERKPNMFKKFWLYVYQHICGWILGHDREIVVHAGDPMTYLRDDFSVCRRCGAKGNLSPALEEEYRRLRRKS
jgi:hypothetical protein